MISCSKCGRSLPDHAKFCSGCGTPVRMYGNSVIPALTCISCGAALKPEAVFCPVCGMRQNADNKIITPPEEREEEYVIPEPYEEIFTPSEPTERSDAAPEPPEEWGDEIFVCSNSSCGAQLPYGAVFCGKCGSPAIKMPVKKEAKIPAAEETPTLCGDLSDTEKGSSGTLPERGFFSEAGDL